MKKAYVKPEIMFDDFTLSTNIAAGCEVRINTMYPSSCGYRVEAFGQQPVFVAGASGCEIEIVDGSLTNDSVCYHVPSDSRNLFNS